MAQDSSTFLFTLEVDDKGAVQSVNNLTASINSAGTASQSWATQLKDIKTQLAATDPNSKQFAELALQYKELGGSSKVVSESVEELKAKLEGYNETGTKVETSTKSLKAQLRELQTTLATTDPSSEKYNELATAAGKLKDQIKDASEAVGAQAGPAFERVGGSLGLVTSRLGSLDFSGAAEGANLLAKNLKDVKPAEFAKGIGDVGKSFVNVGKALLANPIFLIGAAIALLITNFDKLANTIPALGIAFEAIGAVVNVIKDAITGFTDAIGLTSVATADAVDGAIGSLDSKQKDLENAQRLAVANARKTGADVTAIKKDFQNKEVANNNDLVSKINALEKRGVKLTEDQLKARQKAIDANKELAIKSAEEEATAVEKAREDAAKTETDRLAKEEQNREAARQKAQQAAEARKAREAEVTDAIKQAQEERYQLTLTDEERELRQLQLKYDKLIEKAGKNQNLITQLEEQQLLDRQAIRDRNTAQEIADQEAADAKLIDAQRAASVKANEDRISRDDAQFKLQQELDRSRLKENEARREKAVDDLVSEYDEKFAIASGNAAQEAELTRQQKAELARINNDYRTAEKTADTKSQQDRVDSFTRTSALITQSAQDGISTLLSLNDAFSGKSEASQKKSFQRNKALQIAQTTVSTYQSATSAYASQVIPGDPSSVVRGVIAAATAVAAGLANVAKIKATTFSSPAPSGGSNSSTGGLSGGGGDLASQGVVSSGVPEFNPLASLNLNQPQQIQPAYVLAGDIANAMEARAKVTDLSRL
jgi:hypothetical protein